MDAAAELEALRCIKARYCRFLDGKDWVAWRALFADDFLGDMTGSGGQVIRGADEFVVYVRRMLGSSSRTTVHQVHAPELELISETAARGIWALEDFVRFSPGLSMRGYGHYQEIYEKQGASWYIKSSALTRLRCDVHTPVFSFTIPRSAMCRGARK